MAATAVIEGDSKPEFRVAVFGLSHRLHQVLEAVLRHARHNRYRYVVASKHGPGDFDIAMVDMTVSGGDELARTLKRLASGRPVLTIGRRNDATRARDDLLQAHFTVDLLPTLNGTVERYRLSAAGQGTQPLPAQTSATLGTAPANAPAAPSRIAAAVATAQATSRAPALPEVARPIRFAGAPAPAAPSALSVAPRAGSGVAQETLDGELPRPRALIVDDSPTVLHQLALALLRMGVDSEAVGSIRDARSALEAWVYDIAIIDVVMADGDGFKLTREIKRNTGLKSMRLIILTSRSSPFDLARGALAGCNSYLVKPVSPQSLRDAVVRNLNWLPKPAAACKPSSRRRIALPISRKVRLGTACLHTHADERVRG